MAMGTDDLAAKMERQTILQDKWNTLNATSFDDITELITAKGGSSWSEDVGKYTITTTIDAAGKYANAACTDGTLGEDDRQCRQVHLTIKDNETGKTQALDVTKIAPESGGGGGGTMGFPDYANAKILYGTDGITTAGGYAFCITTAPEDGFLFIQGPVYVNGIQAAGNTHRNLDDGGNYDSDSAYWYPVKKGDKVGALSYQPQWNSYCRGWNGYPGIKFYPMR